MGRFRAHLIMCSWIHQCISLKGSEKSCAGPCSTRLGVSLTLGLSAFLLYTGTSWQRVCVKGGAPAHSEGPFPEA